MLGRGLNPQRFVALLDEFRHKITEERIAARLDQVKQDELIALVKLQAEVKARYLVAVLDLIAPTLTDLESSVAEAKRFREMAEEIERGVKTIVEGVIAKEIPMAGIEFDLDYSPDIETAIEAFIAAGAEDFTDS